MHIVLAGFLFAMLLMDLTSSNSIVGMSVLSHATGKIIQTEFAAYSNNTDPIIMYAIFGSLNSFNHQGHVWTSVRQSRMLNPTLCIYLVTNAHIVQHLPVPLLKELKVDVVLIDDPFLFNSPFIQQYRKERDRKLQSSG